MSEEGSQPVAPGRSGDDAYRAAFDANPQPMWIIACGSARLLAVNEAALANYGYGERELLALTLFDLRAADDDGRSREIIEALCTDLPGRKPLLRSLRQRRRDGSVIEVELASHTLLAPFAGQRARLFLVRDVTDHRRMERAESRYQALLENSSDKVLFLGTDGRILECNALAERDYGYTREELLRMRISDLRDPGSQQDMSRQLASATADGLRFETVHKRRDGSSFPVQVSSRAVLLGGERVLVSVIRDISDERRARAVLQSVEQRLRLMLEEAPLAVVVLDRAGKVEYANPFFLTLTGRSWVEVVGRHAFGGFLAATRVTPARAHVQGELSTRAGVRQMSWTQSTIRDAAGEPEGFLYIGSDMTEHWHAERSLRESEKRFRTLIEGNPDGVALCSGGLLTYVNPALAAMLGRSSEELIGRDAVALVHQSDRPLLAARLGAPRLRAAPGAAEPLQELRFLRRDGKLAHAEVASLQVEADGGYAVLLVARDVSERRTMQGKLVQASRLASVGTLAAGVAHEINNPLAYIEANLGYVRQLWPQARAELRARRQGLPPPPPEGPALDDTILDEVAAALDESGTGIERVRHVVAGLKEFAQREADQLGRISVLEALEAALELIAHELKHRGSIVRDLQPVPQVFGQESRITQVFINLILNAVQSLPEDARQPGEIRVSTRTDALGRAVISVEDTGCGIPAEDLARIFDPFFTTREVGAGAGLGLSIAHGIVNAMGGEIEAESTLGKGTVLRVVLPPAEPGDG